MCFDQIVVPTGGKERKTTTRRDATVMAGNIKFLHEERIFFRLVHCNVFSLCCCCCCCCCWCYYFTNTIYVVPTYVRLLLKPSQELQAAAAAYTIPLRQFYFIFLLLSFFSILFSSFLLQGRESSPRLATFTQCSTG